ncbi:hypothetical protein BBJ28_00022083 [Nothophytophthora sp. Chile5]|nr:hypothetical protein BBJ28_00022083 [Nothophytophthora sp. Chile5]
MERAIRLDSDRLLASLESAAQDLELLATLPENALAASDTGLGLAAGSALQPALLQPVDEGQLPPKQQRRVDRPETEDDDEDHGNEEQEDSEALLQSDNLAVSSCAAVRLFPKSLHRLLRQLKDRTARDALRKLCATSVSPAMSRLAQAWIQLIINTEVALATSSEQDESLALSLREVTLRLREAEDDRKQVGFELAQACETRAAMNQKFATQQAALEAQLRDLKRAADDVLGPTARDREQDLQAALSNFETQNSNAHEQLEAIGRSVARVTQASQQVEGDARKHKEHDATELREVLARYDADMERLDAEIEVERRELRSLDAASATFEKHFGRIDDDRRCQLDEQRALELEERLRRSRDNKLFSFVVKLQAVMRGFLVRRHLRLEAQRKLKRKGKKGRKKPSAGTRKKKSSSKKKPTVNGRVKKA